LQDRVRPKGVKFNDCIAKWKNLINTSLRKKVEKG